MQKLSAIATKLTFEDNTVILHNFVKLILFYSKHLIIWSGCCFSVDLMASSPPLKILDNLNLASSESI